MIIDRISNLSKYTWLNTAIPGIAAFIETQDLQRISEKGSVGNVSYIPISSKEAGPDFNEQVLEAHRKYYDLHIVLSGEDIINFTTLESNLQVFRSYDEANDYLLVLSAGNKNFVHLSASYFCIIPPHIAHMALFKGHKDVKKLVFKIPVE